MGKRVPSLFNQIILTLLLPICLTTILWVWLVQVPIQAHIPDSQASDRDLWRTLNTPFERINQVLEDKEENIWVVSASSYSITEVLTHTDTITNTTQTSETIKTVAGKGIARFDNGKWITYTVESTNGGLPSDNILSAFFDTKGNLWFGTFTKDTLKGLQGLGATRFDGQAWYTFTNKDGLAPGVVVDIEEDDQGGLWFVTTTGLSHLTQSGKWESFTDGKILGGKSILDAYRTNDGALWIAASKLKGSGSCLSRYQNGKWYPCEIEGIPFDIVGQLAREKTGRWWVKSLPSISLILDQSDNPASLDTNIAFFDGKIWRKGGPEGSNLTNQFVTKMYQDRNGNLWFGLEHGLIWQEPWGSKLTDEFGFEGTSSISDILYDVTDNLVWVATAEGLKYYTGYHRQTFSEDTGDLGSSLLDWFKASDGTIWAGTDRGVSHYQNGAWKTFSVESGDLSNNPARKLFEAKDGAIWALLGSVTGKNSWSWAGGGVSRYQNGKWQNFNVESGYLNSDEVGDLFEASDGTIWARAYKGGVSRYHNGKWETFSVESGDLPDNDVQALAEASDGAIWARTWGGGVSRYQNGNWQTFSGTSGDLGSNKARIWLETSDGVIWIGTSGGGVSHYQDNKWQTFNMDSGDLGGNDVQDLLEAGDGTVWVATNGGVSRYQGGKWQTFNVESGDLGSNDVQDLLEAIDGAIWVETEEGGVSRYQGDKWQIFNVESGDLNTNLVSNLFEAKDGAIWVVLCERTDDNSTSCPGPEIGASRYQDGKWQTFTSKEYRNLDIRSGANESSLSRQVTDSYGFTWRETTYNNLVRSLPGHRPPWIEFTTFNNIPLTTIPTHTLAYDDRRLLVGFKGDDLATRSEELQYYYWLEGWDKDWQSIRYYEIISYPPKNSPLSPFLEPGYYTLHLKAVDEDGNESKQARLDITVAEPPPPPTPLPTPLPLIKEIPKEVPVEIPVEPRYTLPGLGVSATLPQFLLGGIGLGALVVLGSFGAVWWRKRQRVRQNVLNKINPYIAGPPIDDPELFFGREELIATIIRNLPNNHIALEGPRRSGKSSLLKQLAHRLHNLDDPDYYFVPVLFDCHETTEQDFFYDSMGALLTTLGEVDPGLALPSLVYQPAAYAAASGYDNRAFKNDLKLILAALVATRPQQIRIILLLDEGDALNEYEQTTQRKIRNLISQTPALKMVWAGIRVLTAAGDPTSPWYNMQVTDTLPSLAEAEARRLITQPVAKLGYVYDEAALNRILERAKGQPYLIQYLCLNAVNAMLNEERSTVTLADVESALGKLEQEKSADDPGSVLYQPRQQPETMLSIAEKPAPYQTEDEQP